MRASIASNAGCRNVFGIVLLATVLSASPALSKPTPVAPAAHAKAEEKSSPEMREADAAYVDGEFARALDLYQRIDTSAPSSKLRLKIADCMAELGKYSEALDVLSGILQGSEVQPDAKEKTRVEQLQAKLLAATSVLVLRVLEKEAQVLVDGVEIGRGPLERVIRRKPGHVNVVVTKSGFRSFSRELDLVAGGEERVAAELVPEQTQGALVVQLVGKESANLVLDGKDVGPLPFTGEIPSGVHDIYARGPHGISATRKIVITAGGRNELELTLVENPAKLRVTASDARAVIRIDGTPYGSGQIQTEVLPGKHIVSVEQPGYVPSVYHFVLEAGEFKALDHVVLERAAPSTNTKSVRSKQGVYTMVALDGLIGKATNTFAAECPLSGLGGTCSSGPTFGGQLDVHVGYSFGTFGAEGFVLGGTNFTLARANQSRDIAADESAWFGIARKERYFLFEPVFGGGAAGRVSTQGKSFKLSTSVGLGLVYRFVELQRNAQAQLGSSSDSIVRKDEKSGWTGGEGKVMPLFVWDSEIQLGPTPGTRVFLGIHSQVEFGAEPRVTPASSTLGFETSTGKPLPLGAGPIESRRSPAFYIGPRFGVVTGT